MMSIMLIATQDCFIGANEVFLHFSLPAAERKFAFSGFVDSEISCAVRELLPILFELSGGTW